MKVALCYSGGMDSRVLLHYAAHHQVRSRAIYWAHGAREEAQEIASLPRGVTVRRVDWLNLPNLAGGLHGKPTDVNAPIYIPGRNLAFAVLTACQELPDEVWIGALANEQGAASTDKNVLFRGTASAALSAALSPFCPGGVRVRCPLAEEGWDKSDAAHWAVANGLPLGELALSWSCRAFHQEGDDRDLPCGNCDQCLRRAAIFAMLGYPGHERTARPLLQPGEGRRWLVALYQRARTEGWPERRDGPCGADCRPFMNHLAPLIEEQARGDDELAGVASLMREDMLWSG